MTYHFSGVVFGVVGEQILANEGGLLVVPLGFEHESLLLDYRHVCGLEGSMGLGELRHF